MNDFGPRPPLYLVIDVAEPGQAQRKNKLVNDVINGLRREASPNDNHPIVLITFAEEALLRERGQVGYLSWIGGVRHRPGRDRSFARVFEMLRDTLAEDAATVAGAGPEGAVVVFVTDGPDPSSWHPVFASFSHAMRPTMVTVAHGHADTSLSEYLEGGAGLGPKVSRRADVADVVVDTVIQWVRNLQAYGGQSGPRASEVVGSGFRYTVAAPEPGAGSSRRPGITTVPMHRGGPDSSTRPAGVPAAMAISDGPRMQTDIIKPIPAASAEPASAVYEEPRTVATPQEPVTDVAPTTKLPVTHPTPETPPTPTTDTGGGRAAAATEWKGLLEPYEVGDPGNAFKVRSLPDKSEWNQRDTVLDGVTLVDDDDRVVAEVRAASLRGLSHRHSGTVRQDDYAYRRTDDGRYLVCAISDGVSSARLSHKAAAIVTRQGCEILTKQLREQAPGEIDWATVVNGIGAVIKDFGTRLLQKALGPADTGGVTDADVLSHMAATAVFAVVDLRGAGDALPVHVCAVGDSSAWILRGSRWDALGEVKNDTNTIATSKTRALPHPVSEPPRSIEDRLGPGDVLVLMSDGVGDPLGDGTGPVGRFLATKWAQPPLALEFAAQVDFARRSHDDDRTALAVWPVRSP